MNAIHRQADSHERTVPTQRFRGRRQWWDEAARSSRRLALGIGTIVPLLAIACGFFLPFGHDGWIVRGACFAMGSAAIAISISAVRRNARLMKTKTLELKRDEDRAAFVREWKFRASRVVVAPDPEGEDDYWLFKLDPKGWFVVAASSCSEDDAPSSRWGVDTHLVFDGNGVALTVRCDGDAIAVERQVEPWTPPVETTALPTYVEVGPG